MYGFFGLDLEGARALVERALKVQLSPHDSVYRGGDYYRLKDGDAELFLQRNYDCLDDGLAEAEFPEVRVLLYIDGKQHAEEISDLLRAQVPEASLLRHVTY